MLGEFDIFLALKPFLTVVSPIIFGIGLLLLLAPGSYKKLEELLNEEVGGIRKRVLPWLEESVWGFHKWLLVRINAMGLICLITGIVFYIIGQKI